MDGTHDVRFLRVDEVALEARVSRSTVRHWLRVGRLESVKLGKHRVVPRAAFERMIASGTAQFPGVPKVPFLDGQKNARF